MSKVSLFAFVLFAVVFTTYGYEYKQKADNNLLNVLLKSSSSIEDSPQRSLECFTIYGPKITELADKYEIEHETCLQRSADARSVIEGEVEGDRNDLENIAVKICGGFQTCSTDSASSYDFFECYNNIGSETTKAAYNIQNVSKDKMEYIKMKYETIMYDQDRCTDECSRVYVEDSGKVFGDLEKCLAGITVEPTV